MPHTLLNVPRCSTLQKKMHCFPRHLSAMSFYSIRGGKGWPGSRGRLSIPLFFCVHAQQDASSRPPLPPLLWLASARCHAAACHHPDSHHWFCCFSVFITTVFFSCKIYGISHFLITTVFLFHERGNTQGVGGREIFHLTQGKFPCVSHVHLRFLNVQGNQGYRVELSSVLQSSEVQEKCIKDVFIG